MEEITHPIVYCGDLYFPAQHSHTLRAIVLFEISLNQAIGDDPAHVNSRIKLVWFDHSIPLSLSFYCFSLLCFLSPLIQSSACVARCEGERRRKGRSRRVARRESSISSSRTSPPLLRLARLTRRLLDSLPQLCAAAPRVKSTRPRSASRLCSGRRDASHRHARRRLAALDGHRRWRAVRTAAAGRISAAAAGSRMLAGTQLRRTRSPHTQPNALADGQGGL